MRVKSAFHIQYFGRVNLHRPTDSAEFGCERGATHIRERRRPFRHPRAAASRGPRAPFVRRGTAQNNEPGRGPSRAGSVRKGPVFSCVILGE